MPFLLVRLKILMAKQKLNKQKHPELIRMKGDCTFTSYWWECSVEGNLCTLQPVTAPKNCSCKTSHVKCIKIYLKNIHCRVIGHSPKTQINLCIHQYNNILIIHNVSMGFPGSTSGKERVCQYRRHKRCSFSPWVRKIPCRRAWPPTPGFLPGEPHGQRSLVGYSPWGLKGVEHNWSDLSYVS